LPSKGERRLLSPVSAGVMPPVTRRKRIYLDVCCLNRPFDEQGQDRVRLEAEAVKSVLFHIGAGRWIGVGSEVIDLEIGRLPDPDRHLEVVSIVEAFTE
jgi:hypothetical protein